MNIYLKPTDQFLMELMGTDHLDTAVIKDLTFIHYLNKIIYPCKTNI